MRLLQTLTAAFVTITAIASTSGTGSMYQDGPRTPEELIQMLDHDIQNEEFQVEAAGLSNAERRLNALASLALNDLNIFQKVMKEARLMDNEIISRSDWDRFYNASVVASAGNPEAKIYANSNLKLKHSTVFRETHDKTNPKIYENDIENDIPTDAICDAYSSKYMPYTGFRFFTTSELGWLFLHKKTSHLVYCYQGKEITRSSLPMSFGKRDILWGEKYCFTMADQDYDEKATPLVRGCYIPARTYRVQSKERLTGASWHRPERFYGGLFRYLDYYDGGERSSGGLFERIMYDNDRSIPVAPLISDEPFMGFASSSSESSSLLYVPLAYTPDYFSEGYPRESDVWAENIDVSEDYVPPPSIFDEWDSGPLYEYEPFPAPPPGYEYSPGGPGYEGGYGSHPNPGFGSGSWVLSASDLKKVKARRRNLMRRVEMLQPVMDLFSKRLENLSIKHLPKDPKHLFESLKPKLQRKKSPNATLTALSKYVEANFRGDYEYIASPGSGYSYYDNSMMAPGVGESPNYNPFNPFLPVDGDDPFKSRTPIEDPGLIDEFVNMLIDLQLRLFFNNLKTRLVLVEDKRLAKYLYMLAYYTVFPY